MMTREHYMKDLMTADDVFEQEEMSVWAQHIAAHDAEQRQQIEQQAEEIARLREALKVPTIERNSAYWKIRSRIERVVVERNEVGTGDSCYVVFWPRDVWGYHSAYDLRILADILDDRNKAWDETVKRELSNPNGGRNESLV